MRKDGQGLRPARESALLPTFARTLQNRRANTSKFCDGPNPPLLEMRLRLANTSKVCDPRAIARYAQPLPKPFAIVAQTPASSAIRARQRATCGLSLRLLRAKRFRLDWFALGLVAGPTPFAIVRLAFACLSRAVRTSETKPDKQDWRGSCQHGGENSSPPFRRNPKP